MYIWTKDQYWGKDHRRHSVMGSYSAHRWNEFNICGCYYIINVKKTTVYIHVNGDRPSHIENSKNKKVILLYHCTSSSYINVQQYSKITFFIFAVFDVRMSVAVNMCINCSFFTSIFAVFSVNEFAYLLQVYQYTVNQTFDYLVVNFKPCCSKSKPNCYIS